MWNNNKRSITSPPLSSAIKRTRHVNMSRIESFDCLAATDGPFHSAVVFHRRTTIADCVNSNSGRNNRMVVYAIKAIVDRWRGVTKHMNVSNNPPTRKKRHRGSVGSKSTWTPWEHDPTIFLSIRTFFLWLVSEKKKRHRQLFSAIFFFRRGGGKCGLDISGNITVEEGFSFYRTLLRWVWWWQSQKEIHHISAKMTLFDPRAQHPNKGTDVHANELSPPPQKKNTSVTHISHLVHRQMFFFFGFPSRLSRYLKVQW